MQDIDGALLDDEGLANPFSGGTEHASDPKSEQAAAAAAAAAAAGSGKLLSCDLSILLAFRKLIGIAELVGLLH